LPDGFWYEGTASYHFYALNALEKQALTMKAAGMDIYKQPKFKALYQSPLDYTFPDGRFPAVNDSDPLSIYDQDAHYEIAYALFGDGRFASVAAKGERDTREAFLFGSTVLATGNGAGGKSRVFPGLGALMLRQEQSTSPLAVHLDYGPHGGGHGHPDKLGIVLFANGHDAMPDAGRLAYGAPLHDRWYTTTLAHNTVVVDGKNQRPAEGRLVQYDCDNLVQTATAVCDTAYDDVVITRSIALAPEYMLDVVAGVSKTTRTWDLAYHVRGKVDTEVALAPFDLPEKSSGYQVLENVVSADVDGAWVVRVAHKNGSISLNFGNTGETKVILADGLVDKAVTTCPVVLARRVETAPSWITVVSPGGTNGPDLKISKTVKGWEAIVTTSEGCDTYAISAGSLVQKSSTRNGPDQY
jgi:oligo-alginate lyase